jgi:hypothetical protein
LLVLALVAVGCASDPYLPAPQAQSLLQVEAGMSRDEVVAQLGEPHRQETVGAAEFLFYRTDWRTATEAQRFSPVAVVDGKVVGLGKVYYEDAIRAERRRLATASIKATPTRD